MINNWHRVKALNVYNDNIFNGPPHHLLFPSIIFLLFVTFFYINTIVSFNIFAYIPGEVGVTVMEEDLRLCSVKPVLEGDRRFCFEVLSPAK